MQREDLYIDVETTGLCAHSDAVIEVAWCVAGAPARGGGSLVRLDSGHVPPWVERMTGIRSAALRDAPRLEDVMRGLAVAMQDARCVHAYNAPFDRSFVDAAATQCGIQLPARPWVDVLALAKKRLPTLERHRLADVARALGVDVPAKLHRAAADAALCALVHQALVEVSSQKREAAASDDVPSKLGRKWWRYLFGAAAS
jgi:DNA polymerase III subunit epsilon